MQTEPKTAEEALEYDLHQGEMGIRSISAYPTALLAHYPCRDERGRKVGINVILEGMIDEIRMVQARIINYRNYGEHRDR